MLRQRGFLEKLKVTSMLQKREVHTRAIVIARRSAGEGSVRVSLYTEELGLVSALVTSAREERSKLRPHLMVALS